MYHLRRFSSSVRPFRVLGLQQVAVGGTSKQALAHFWGDLLGVSKIGDYKSEKENVDEDIYQLGKGVGSVELDIMQPLDETKSPKVHIPPLNHIGLWVDNLQVAYSHLTEKGVRFAPGGVRKGAAGHDVAFIHPKGSKDLPYSGEGVLVELVQAPKDVIDAFDANK